jgi:hypothetical protein
MLNKSLNDELKLQPNVYTQLIHWFAVNALLSRSHSIRERMYHILTAFFITSLSFKGEPTKLDRYSGVGVLLKLDIVKISYCFQLCRSSILRSQQVTELNSVTC